MNLLIILFIIIPVLAAIFSFLTRKYTTFSISGSLLNLILCIIIYHPLHDGKVLKLSYNCSSFISGFTLRMDFLSYIFIAVVSLVWVLATVYSRAYINNDNRLPRYYIFLMLTYSSLMGLFLSADFLTLFLFFEIMTITSYVLVVHDENREARRGGFYYLIMGIMGGLLILWGTIFLYKTCGNVNIGNHILADNNSSIIKYIAAFLLIAGFGVKAGMVPLHIWLPKAHPVAPSPASALLSGIIIKAGAYGILRVIIHLYWLPGENLNILKYIATGLIFAGSWTMLLGVIKALQQNNFKKMLAYHSISQMGYILVGFGVAEYLGSYGAAGFTGSIYHIINHALFKTNLFLILGAVYFTTGKFNIKQLGGMRKKYPVITVAFLISAMGISGIPGLNGYISKTLIHHGLLETVKISGDIWFLIVEKIFIITSAGTFVSFLKLGYFVFWRNEKEGIEKLPDIPFLMRIVVCIFSLLIVVMGICPELFIENFVVPLFDSYNFHIEPVYHISFWSFKELLSTGQYLLPGLVFFTIALKFSLFNYHFSLNIYLKRVHDFIITMIKRLLTIYKLIFSRRINTKTAGLIFGIERTGEKKHDLVNIESIDLSKIIVAMILTIILICFIIGSGDRGGMIF